MERGEKPGWKKGVAVPPRDDQVDNVASPLRGKPQLPFIGVIFSGGNRFRTVMQTLIKVSLQPKTYTVVVMALQGSWSPSRP
jgi:hypothetical protein